LLVRKTFHNAGFKNYENILNLSPENYQWSKKKNCSLKKDTKANKIKTIVDSYIYNCIWMTHTYIHQWNGKKKVCEETMNIKSLDELSKKFTGDGDWPTMICRF